MKNLLVLPFEAEYCENKIKHSSYAHTTLYLYNMCHTLVYITNISFPTGWLYNTTTDKPVNSQVPLEVFKVAKGHRYRFRVISATKGIVYEIAIDGHALHVIATDGEDVRTTVVDSLIINGGERYDFYIEAKDPNQIGNYWIRATSVATIGRGTYKVMYY